MSKPPRKGYVGLPRWMFDHPQWPELAPSAKELLFALLDLAGLKDPETLDELAVRARVSTRSAERGMPQLVALGWVEKIGGTGRQKARYVLRSTAKSGGATPPVVPPDLAEQDGSADTLSDTLSDKSGGATGSLYSSSTSSTPIKENCAQKPITHSGPIPITPARANGHGSANGNGKGFYFKLTEQDLLDDAKLDEIHQLGIDSGRLAPGDRGRLFVFMCAERAMFEAEDPPKFFNAIIRRQPGETNFTQRDEDAAIRRLKRDQLPKPPTPTPPKRRRGRLAQARDNARYAAEQEGLAGNDAHISTVVSEASPQKRSHA